MSDSAETKTLVLNPALKEIAFTFLRLGITAFGGPAAHIAMMEEELVRRRQWLSHEEFLDLVGAANLIPGPNSTEVAIHVGHKMQGWRGLVTAGVSFIVPAFLIVWALAWFYVKYGSIPAFQSVLLGIKPVILAVIAQAIWNLSRTAIKDRILGIFCIVSLLFYLFGYNELLILVIVAISNLVFRLKIPPTQTKIMWLAIPATLLIPNEKLLAQVSYSAKVPVENLFLFFIKVGSVLFGSGYVLIAFLQSDLVHHYQWITNQQLLDAIAIGQFTPGPVFTTATFIGYLIAGHAGAISATIGIFLPAFFFVAVSAPLIPTLRKSKWTAPILDGLNVASLSLMAGAGFLLAKDAISNAFGGSILVVSLVLLTRYKINSAWLVLVAGLLGLVIY